MLKRPPTDALNKAPVRAIKVIPWMKREKGKERKIETLSETASGKGRLPNGPAGGGQSAATRTGGDWLATDAGATKSRK